MTSRLGQGTAAGAGVPARLGLLNGGLIGLALALGALGPGALVAGGAVAPLWYAGLVSGLIALVVLAGLTGWVTAFLRKTALSLLLWMAAGVGITTVLGHLPYEGNTLMAWLLDRRFWGLPLFPFSPAALARQVMAGFFIFLALAILGLLYLHRLEGIADACTADQRLTARAWLLLLLPLPLLFGVGLIADNLAYQPVRRALGLTDQVIRTARTYDGDLFALSIERGVNYNAAAAVRHLLSPSYTLSIGEIELGAAGTVFVVAHFDNGAWVNCRIVADQVSFCWDASPAYLRGLPALLAGQTVADCPECTVAVDAAARTSLEAQQARFAEPPQVHRLAQQGSYVWMRAESLAGDQAVDCLLQGITPVRLVECRAVSPAMRDATWNEILRSNGFSRSAQPQATKVATTKGRIFRADVHAAIGSIAGENAAEHPERSEAQSKGRSEAQSKGRSGRPVKVASFRRFFRLHGQPAEASSPGRRAAIFRAVHPGRAPGLMAMPPQMATPEPPAGIVAPERGEAPMGMATPDRLSPPPTVYPPTQADMGAQVYWFRCMVCHGDRGQGLTEEWRNAWDPSHRNCWQSRCHASNHPPEGFQLPYYAPPVIGPGTLARFATLADLHAYLAAQMPWQAPGSLPPEEYWQLAAYLARANGAAVADADLNPQAAAKVKLVRALADGDQVAAAGPVQVTPWVIGIVLSAVSVLLAGRMYVRRRWQ